MHEEIEKNVKKYFSTINVNKEMHKFHLLEPSKDGFVLKRRLYYL